MGIASDLGRAVLVGTAGAVLVAGYATARIWEQGARDEQRPADAIVVLGAAQYDGRPSPVFRARLDHAVALFKAELAPVLVVTGGRAEGDRTTEGAVARRYALAHGVPESAIRIEEEGRTTMESMRTVGRIFREEGFRTGIFVSDRTHMLRVLRMARDEGITAWGSPTRTSPIDREPAARLEATLHELAALAVYFLTGDVPTVRLDAVPGGGG